ncbi:MAG: hypothetical protein QGF00_25015 [Planctomycetota bacterium]|nr:hypothetical protein [Planctomycetota bacterium]
MTKTSFALILLSVCLQGLFAERWWDEVSATNPIDEVFGEGGEISWELPPPTKQVQYEFAREEALDRPVLTNHGPRYLTVKGRTVHGSGIEVVCRVRLLVSEKRKNIRLQLALAKDPQSSSDPGVNLSLSATHGRPNVYLVLRTAFFTKRFNLNLNPYPVISPVLAENVRRPLEAAMAAAPAVAEKWLTVRCQLGHDWLRVWLDDRLVADLKEADLKVARDEARKTELERINALTDPKVKAARLKVFKAKRLRKNALPTSGFHQVTLPAGGQLSDFQVTKLKGFAGSRTFETIALDGYVRARELLGKRGTAVSDESLPFGKAVEVNGIPFRFAKPSSNGGADHIDVGESLLRQANMEGYFPSRTQRFIGASAVDPARIQLRIPNGRYDALHVIAAFDEEKNSIPILTASFYRPVAGFPKLFETTIPSYRDKKSSSATPLPVRLETGRKANLWLVTIPLDPAALASFSDLDILELELTKKVYQYRSYPDPYIYGWHQGGLPSGVHVYAATLRRPELHMKLEPVPFGHVWTAPQKPLYKIQLQNRSEEARQVTLTAETTSYDGEETTKQEKEIIIPAGKTVDQPYTFTIKKHGIHVLRVTLSDGKTNWTEERNFCRLAPDTRPAKFENGKGPMFGFWSYAGGHHTPPAKEHYRLMAMAGARGYVHYREPKDTSISEIFEKHNFQFGPNAWPIRPQWSWAAEENPDPKKRAEFQKTAIANIRKAQGDNPSLLSFYPEPHLSQRLTAGNPQDYWGEPPYEYTDAERRALRVFTNTSIAAAEAVRKEWPDAKILIPWGDPGFIWPLLRSGFPKHLIDGSGLDMIGFERLPEQQIHQQSNHRLYILREEYRKFGMKKPFLPYVEGTFVPTEPGACTWDEQANLYHRWTILSLAYGITHFYSGWFAFDCGNYYGAEHYGGCGIQRRIPYADPKPAYAHYATMTRMLDHSKFEKWLPTGSHSTYCLKFNRLSGGPAFVLWTLRGKREVSLTLNTDATVTITDSMDNGVGMKSSEGAVKVKTGPSPIYVTGADIKSVQVGEADHSDAVQWSRTRNQRTWFSGPIDVSLLNQGDARTGNPQIQRELKLGSLGDGSWILAPAERDQLYESNNYDTARYHGKMSARIVTDEKRAGTHLAIRLEKQDKVRKLMPWYSVLRPRKPIVIPGKARHLALWVKANSDWGRVVYSLKDAKGERWVSIGTKDQWNCDDVHSWSSFNFDGWRRIHFELPSHAAYDTFREYGTTWWRYTDDGIVDLPLTIEKIIIERRTHVLYVNDIQRASSGDVLLSDLSAEYETGNLSSKAVVQSRIRMPLPKAPEGLKNLIQEMVKNPLLPTRLHKVTDPDWGYDGTRCHVHFDGMIGAAQYQVWVAAHLDGRGAVKMATFKKAGELLQRLRPAVQLYLWVTWSDKGEGKEKKQSQPSNVLPIKLVDAFGQK